jgi:GMP synthase (glutamine-hydrolysing)
MNILIVKHIDIEGPGLIEYYLNQEKIPFRILNLQASSRLPKIDNLSHVVFLGGPMNVYEEDRYPFLKEEDLFIKEAIQRGKGVLGICLGAQLIAKAIGAKVFKAPVKEIGWYDVSLTGTGSSDPIFSKLPNTFPVFQWHEDTFEIPHAGKLIATSSSVPNQAFRYGENTYGLQFHLEVTQEMILEWMKTYEEEFKGSQPPLFSKFKILADTEMKIEGYARRGMEFLKGFFRQPHPHPFPSPEGEGYRVLSPPSSLPAGRQGGGEEGDGDCRRSINMSSPLWTH